MQKSARDFSHGLDLRAEYIEDLHLRLSHPIANAILRYSSMAMTYLKRFGIWLKYILDAVGSSGILKGKQKLGVIFNSDKLGGIDFTKFSKLTMCSA